jgi:antitoxin component YwqK of YwqJK toxin-antitoxin module
MSKTHYKDGVISKLEFYREDGTLEEIGSFENGIRSKLEFYREDETPEERHI